VCERYCAASLWTSSGLVQEAQAEEIAGWLVLREDEPARVAKTFEDLKHLQEPWMQGREGTDGKWERQVLEDLQQGTLGRFIFAMLLQYVREKVMREPSRALEGFTLLSETIRQWDAETDEKRLERQFLLKELCIGRRSEHLPSWSGVVTQMRSSWTAPKATPCLVPNAMPRIQFSLHETVTAINEAVAADHMFEASILKDYPAKLVQVGSDVFDYELTFIMGIQTEVQIAFDSDKLSSLERVDVKLQRHYPMQPENKRWLEWKPKRNQLDFNITVVDGDLVIKGLPQAHWGDRDVRIDQSGQRFRHYFAQITPQNKAGDGKPVKVLITCRPLKVFWGVAQTYTSPKIADIAEKLECCKADLDTMVKDHRELGFDILISCLDATGVGFDNSMCIVVRIIQKVKATDIVYYISGHGYEREETSKTMLLLRDEQNSADWNNDRNNLCIQDTVEKIAKVADNSTFLLFIVDACRERLRAPEFAKNGPVSDTVLKLRISKMPKQTVIWFATSSGRLSIGGSGQAELSRFTGVLHQELVKIAQRKSSELHNAAPGEVYFPGMAALKARVHDQVRNLVLQKVSRRTQSSEAQVPDYREKNVCEAFTFNLPSFPGLPWTSPGVMSRGSEVKQEVKVLLWDNCAPSHSLPAPVRERDYIALGGEATTRSQGAVAASAGGEAGPIQSRGICPVCCLEVTTADMRVNRDGKYFHAECRHVIVID
jgi:hypothetical protein